LRSYGIETAADIQRHRIEQINGFGPATAGSLIAWRLSIERRFVFRPNQPINPADIAAIRADIARRKRELESHLRQSLARLERASNETRSVRNSLHAAAVQVWNAQKQAEIDKLALTKYFPIQARLAGVAAAAVFALILFNAIESLSKPATSAGKDQRQPDISKSIPKPLSQSPPPAGRSSDAQPRKSLGQNETADKPGATAPSITRIPPEQSRATASGTRADQGSAARPLGCGYPVHRGAGALLAQRAIV
jgi:hypothetical protein